MNAPFLSIDTTVLQEAIADAVDTAVRKAFETHRPAALGLPSPDSFSTYRTPLCMSGRRRDDQAVPHGARHADGGEVGADRDAFGEANVRDDPSAAGASIESICKIMGNRRRTIETYIVGTSDDAVREVRAMMA